MNSRSRRLFLQRRPFILGFPSRDIMQHKRTTNIASMEHGVGRRISFGWVHAAAFAQAACANMWQFECCQPFAEEASEEV